jgi:hypothetical protein
LSVSGCPQHDTGSVHEHAPVSPQALTTSISRPHDSQTYTSPVFIS